MSRMMASVAAAIWSNISLRFGVLAALPLLGLLLLPWAPAPDRAMPWGLTLADSTSYISMYGVWVSVIGFSFAIAQVRRTHDAAQSAERAATEVRVAVAERLALGEYGIAAELCPRLSDLIASGNLVAAEEVFRRLRRAVGEANRLAGADDDLAQRMQEIVTITVSMEREVSRAIAGDASQLDTPAMIGALKGLEMNLSDAHSNQRLGSLLETEE